MDAPELLTSLLSAIDARQWDALPSFLHEDFVCAYVHTGETFDRAAWVRVNAEYPGFDHLMLQDLIGAGDRAAARSHVTGHVDGRLVHFEAATFVAVRDGLIDEMTEVWTDVAQVPPSGTRPI
jgi:predicted ester cyclase